MNTIVDFETAKLLKEKGFNTPTFYYYKDGKLVEPYLENGSIRVDLTEFLNHFDKFSEEISAPTIEYTLMWLLSKHNLWISVSMNNNEEDTISFNYTIFKNEEGEVYWEKTINNISSPDECYLKAIKYCLTELIP